jgi:allantoinase
MKRADLNLRGGHLVLADAVPHADVVIDGGKIAAIVDADDQSYSADEEIDARGKHVLPGLVDAHVHFKDPGHAEREGYVTGTRAAAAGGVTTVIDMPLSCTPATTSLAALELKRAVAAEAAIVDHGHWGGLVTDNVEAMAALHEAGVLGFKAFMAETGVAHFPRATDGVLLAGLYEAARLGSVVLVHAENEEIAPSAGLRRRISCAASPSTSGARSRPLPATAAYCAAKTLPSPRTGVKTADGYQAGLVNSRRQPPLFRGFHYGFSQ